MVVIGIVMCEPSRQAVPTGLLAASGASESSSITPVSAWRACNESWESLSPAWMPTLGFLRAFDSTLLKGLTGPLFSSSRHETKQDSCLTIVEVGPHSRSIQHDSAAK